MPLRFRKSIKIAPGLRINLSKSGVSTSFGKRGASVNVSKRGTRVTTGIPGSGISYSQLLGGKKSSTLQAVSQSNAERSSPTSPPLRPLKPKKKLPQWVLIAAGVIALICPASICVSALVSPTPVPSPTLDAASVANTAIANAWISYTQTVAARPTDTQLPTDIVIPTNTVLPNNTASPHPTATLITYSTATVFLFNLPANQPTQASSSPQHPGGTSGQCVDGTYTSAQHKQGACSHHGGVAVWWGP